MTNVSDVTTNYVKIVLCLAVCFFFLEKESNVESEHSYNVLR